MTLARLVRPILSRRATARSSFAGRHHRHDGANCKRDGPSADNAIGGLGFRRVGRHAYRLAPRRQVCGRPTVGADGDGGHDRQVAAGTVPFGSTPPCTSALVIAVPPARHTLSEKVTITVFAPAASPLARLTAGLRLSPNREAASVSMRAPTLRRSGLHTNCRLSQTSWRCLRAMAAARARPGRSDDVRAVRPRLARAAGIARGLAAVLGVLSGLAGGWLLPEPVAAQTAGICDRTLEVRDLIVRSVPGIAHCRDVTADHLAGIELLFLDSRQNWSVQTGDFAGLSNLQTLRLTVPGQRSMSGDMFSGLNELKHLSLSFDRSPLTTLPANLFSGLSSLERLEVFRASSLTTLPANLFSGLDGLRSLSLVDNRLIGLPAGIFSGLDGLRSLSLVDNRLTRLPAGIFSGLTGLTHLFTSGNAFDLYLDLELERVGTGPLQAGSALRFRVKAVQGAPFAIPVTWQARASSGLVNGKASVSGSVTIPKGSISSGTFSLNGTADGGTPPAIALAVTSPGLRSSIPSVDYHPLGIDLRSGSSTNYRGFYFSTPPRIDLNFRDARSVTKSTLSIADAFAQEGNPVEFKVKLSSAVSSDVVVNWATSHGAGSAAAGSNDYTSGSGSLTIPTGQTSGTITVRTTEDIVPEGHETFTLTLSAPGGLPNPVALARKAATGTIFNDDAVLSVSNARGKEGDAISFYVRFSREIFVARGRFEVVGRVTRHIGTTPGDFRTGQCAGGYGGGRSGQLYQTNSGIICDLSLLQNSGDSIGCRL